MSNNKEVKINENNLNKLRLKNAFERTKYMGLKGCLKINSVNNKIEYYPNIDSDEVIDYEYICNFGNYDDAIKMYPVIKKIKEKTNLSYIKIKRMRVREYYDYIKFFKEYN